jgi:hypothetical protein
MKATRLLRFTGAAAVIALLYIGWFFFNRWQQRRDEDSAAAAKQAEGYKQTAELLGTSVKVLNFYVSPGAVKSGGTALMCYGVANAKTVRIEPAVDGVWPAVARCLNVSVRKTTEYKLTADDGAGHTATESLTLCVR